MADSRTPELRVKIAAICGLGLLTVFAHRGWFRPGMIAFGDWHYMVGETTRDLFDVPRAWDPTRDFGRVNESLQGYPYLLAVGVLRRLGAEFSIAERVLFFFPFTFLPLVAMAALTRRFTSSYLAVAVSSSLYALNTYALVVGNNQLTVAMAYAFAPWIAARAVDLGASTARGPLSRVVADAGALVLVTVAAAIYEPRITLLGLLVAGGAFLTVAFVLRAPAMRIAAVTTGAGGAVLVTQVYWLISGLGGSGYVAGLLPQDPFISFATVTHALNLNHPFWRSGPPGVFTQEPPMVVLFLLPTVVLLALAVLARRDLRLAYFGGVALVGAFLVKGENPPFPRFYGWAFDTLPGMRFYRDMSKFSLWTAIGYSLVLGVFCAYAGRYLPRGDPKARFAVMALLAVVAITILVPAGPALTQQQQGTFRRADYPDGLRAVHETLHADRSFGRVLWVGVDQPFLYRTRLHPEVKVLTALEAVSGAAALDVGGLLSSTGFDELGRRGVRYVVTGRDLSPWPGATAEERRSAFDAANDRAREHSHVTLDRGGYRLYRLRNAAPLWFVSASCGQAEEAAPRVLRSWHTRSKVELHEPSDSFAVTYLQAFHPGWVMRLESENMASTTHHRSQNGFNCWDISGQGIDTFSARVRFEPDRTTAWASGVSVVAVVATAVATITLARRARRSTTIETTPGWRVPAAAADTSAT